MADLDRIVNVTITKATAVPSLPSFNTILIAAEFLAALPVVPFTALERVRVYTSLASISTDFGAGHVITLMATGIFSQSPSVQTVYIGRKKTGADGTETWSAALTAMNLYNSGWYGIITPDRVLANQEAIAVWVEANQKFYLADTSDANMLSGTGTIADYIKAANYVRSMAVYSGKAIWNDSVLFTQDAAFVNLNSALITLNGVALAPVVMVGTPATDYAAIKLAIETIWTTAVVTVNATAKTILIVANGLQFNGANSIITTLGASQPVTTATLPDNASATWIAAAWFGKVFPYDPGVINWAFKTLSGIAADGLTGTQITTLRAKNANCYSSIAGVSITQFATIGSGDYADITQGLDWLKSTIQTNIFTLLINATKVPFTDIGIQQIVGQLRAALQAGVAAGIIIDPVVAFPAASDVTAVDKAARNLPDVTFTATLVGAINTVTINGTVVL